MYNVVRGAAAAPKRGFLSQQDLADSVQLEDDPRNTPAKLYFWTPIVSSEERSTYEQFYGFNITDLRNGTGSPVEPVSRDSNRTRFIPYTIFVPPLPPTTNPVIYGQERDKVPFNSVRSNCRQPTNNSYGFVAVAQNKYGRGYMFGRIGSKDLLEFSLTLPRKFVLLAAFVTNANTSRQALFFDDIPDLANATTLAIFNELPTRSFYYTSSFSAFGETIMVAVRYRTPYAAQFAGNTWVILAIVLAPVCFLMDVIWIILALLWHRRRNLLELEQTKRKEAQVMISYVNYEIRNPLQTVLGLADLELEEARDEENHRLIDNLTAIVRAAEFIEHIATDILDLRRLEEGKVEIEMSDVDVGQLMSDLERTAMPLQAGREGADFKVNAEPEIRTVHTDRYRLEQILLNFLTNAFKHTEEGVVTLSVSFATVSWVRFAVWDTGKGIPPEKKAKLFQQFAQVSKEDSSSGFGLGLYLTKMLAGLLGGRVDFESTLGLGSVFWVDLPVEWDRRSLSFQF